MMDCNWLVQKTAVGASLVSTVYIKVYLLFVEVSAVHCAGLHWIYSSQSL